MRILVGAIIALLFIGVSVSFTRKSEAIIPPQEIEEVKIGNQIWMTKNLNVETFSNGDAIIEAKTVDEWKQAFRNKIPAWCYYNNDPANGKEFGKLYNEIAITDPRGLAPKGWRIPGMQDWLILREFLGGRKLAGEKMKSEEGWARSGNGNNESGFNAKPSGLRTFPMIISNRGFMSKGFVSYWWSSHKDKRTKEFWVVSLSARDNHFFSTFDTYGLDGYAVRCIKNPE